ncbi:SDR family oxidoreductase [Streptomyces calvus]|uniref:NAD(P)-dependent dehydrogenase (Short-subunit alcohol dehydrogenase family) n=1 Tax=Streptomyces calvus TaxID=67282 RepID=A0A514JJK7_9ACTN|nr:SDR family oxidoreductase [Streptomyces calvus]MBA8947937.1 NAD(P)-dependent dehydrogenase (short-subunit alcohol dehydrogenase family) [Streptomyces calvus]QDI67500.1 short-chain dehydrogenase [Streptomyces calvus]GGP82528.1 short-chain dehydrogenase [Streptomyces calvus]
MKAQPLRDRTVVITGAARGVGAALARELARRGARPALLGHEGARLEAVAAALPGPALVHEVDVTDEASLADAAERVRERLGVPSAVVANAGVAEGGPFADSDPARWRRVIDVNLTGSAATARAFLPDLRATRGYYLQVASLASIAAAPMMSAYCASKAGVEAFTHALRAEVAHHGIAVGIGYLNWIDTDMIRDGDRYTVLRELRGNMPAPVRRVHPAELAGVRLATAVEHRSTAVYLPRWLRLAQVGRAAVPPVVMRVTRRELARLEAEDPLHSTGLLGAGGTADAPRARPP